MVLKPTASGSNDSDKFENDVKVYGTQTVTVWVTIDLMFENDVKMYGTQTKADIQNVKGLFENDVKMYGTQTTNTVPV